MRPITQSISRTILIEAQPSAIWRALTNPDLMKQWMAEPEMDLQVITNWIVDNPITIRGFHHIKFENKGFVLKFDPDHVLIYNYLSSLSRLPDKADNYTIVDFRLAPVGNNATTVYLTLSNFPTEEIFKHVEFYWNATLLILKSVVEQQRAKLPAS